MINNPLAKASQTQQIAEQIASGLNGGGSVQLGVGSGQDGFVSSIYDQLSKMGLDASNPKTMFLINQIIKGKQGGALGGGANGGELGGLSSLLGSTDSGSITGGGSGGGNTIGCLVQGVPVSVTGYPGFKLSEEIKEHDELLDRNGRAQRVVGVRSSMQPCVLVYAAPNILFIGSESHEVFISQPSGEHEVRQLKNLTPGDVLVGEHSRHAVRLLMSVGEQPVYYWECEPDHEFMAAGVLHHNKILDASASTGGGARRGGL